jgi:hypothetical protein
LEIDTGMKNREFSVIAGLLLIAWACSPISPSVHKSTLRPGVNVLTPPDAQDIPTPQSLKQGPIEARWIHSDKSLDTELEDLGAGIVVKLSSQAVDKLRNEGKVSISLPSEAEDVPSETVRVLLRVNMNGSELEKALARGNWSFDWAENKERTLLIRSGQTNPSHELGLVESSLMSVHVILREEGDEEFTSSL